MPLTGNRNRQYQREWAAARRAAWFADKTCADCGSSDELELDHVDPQAKVSHRIWSWSAARREPELAKCEPRCHLCHLERTKEQARRRYCPQGHDTWEDGGRDSRHHCKRCEREYMREYRKRSKPL